VSEVQLEARLARAGRAVAYLAAGLPIAVLAVVAVAALVLGAALSVVGVGLPILVVAAEACRALVRADRRAANRWLDVHIPPIPARVRTPGSAFRRSLDLLSDRALWRMAAHLAIRPVLIGALLVVALAPVAVLALLLQLGATGLAGAGGVDYVGPWALGPALGLLLCALALPAAALVVATLDALWGVLGAITRAFLTPRAVPAGPVREMLAESLGDRTVSVAYWLPDRERFVDEVGRPVELPAPGSGRAWTAVDADGQRVAAILHDAALDTTPELVEAAASAALLALDNERLKADLRARVEDLRISRARIVDAADAARRRLERDLHDGAQQQLVSLALDLRVLRARLKETDAVELVEEISGKLSVALAELRELARGIHPAILTDRGLGPAVQGLADRVPLPVEVDVELAERPSPAVEAAAYFVVAEALTNIARYAKAHEARVHIARDGDVLTVEVSDDGVGGARIEAGTGLRGLQDRLAALDGRLTIASRPGEGTRLRATLPSSAREAPEPGHARAPELAG
jgi:signal transduction histidine kinase